MRRTAIAAAAALAIAGSHPAAAAAEDVVRIGVVDTQLSDVERPGLTVIHRDYGVQGHRMGIERINRDKTHGDLVVDAIADTRARMRDARPYEVYHANPIFVRDDGRLGMNYAGLKDAMAWFAEHHVKIVTTTFVAPQDSKGMEDFRAAAIAAGITVVASIGNGETQYVPYPAAYPEMLVVDGHHYAQPKSQQRTDALARADAVFDGGTGVFNHPNGVDRNPYAGNGNDATFEPDRREAVQGSSFAVPKAATFLAARMGGSIDLASARAALASATIGKGMPIAITPLPDLRSAEAIRPSSVVGQASTVVASADVPTLPRGNPSSAAAVVTRVSYGADR